MKILRKNIPLLLAAALLIQMAHAQTTPAAAAAPQTRIQPVAIPA